MEEEEIYHLNAYQYISAERIVYGKEKMDLDFVREPLKDERRKNRAAVTRIWEKGWQDKLRNKEIILPQIMRIHREEKEKSGLTIKEIKRGCRLMSNYAEKYWRMHIS